MVLLVMLKVPMDNGGTKEDADVGEEKMLWPETSKINRRKSFLLGAFFLLKTNRRESKSTVSLESTNWDSFNSIATEGRCHRRKRKSHLKYLGRMEMGSGLLSDELVDPLGLLFLGLLLGRISARRSETMILLEFPQSLKRTVFAERSTFLVLSRMWLKDIPLLMEM